MSEPLLAVEGLHVHYPVRGRRGAVLRAVDGVSLAVERGETLGVVGESGCGKSTMALAMLRLIPATGGRVRFDGTEVTSARRRALGPLRRRTAVVLQDSAGALDPRASIGSSVAEPLEVHGLNRGRGARAARVAELLDLVGLDPGIAARRPHQLSGGQRQRVGIARALAAGPELLVCDEPVASLDVSVQARILNLLTELTRDLGLAGLFIAHDLAVVEHISDRVAVMYLGRVVEVGPAARLATDPLHPYTRALVAAVPDPEQGRAQAPPLVGAEAAGAVDLPSGCRFRTRCPQAFDRCVRDDPALHAVGGGSAVACHLFAADVP
ncbi:MAG TPA: ABC transporter ATP-binding protein [Sporichthyaceae bacterium]|jgi:oligopeptide/dipeptide ABC transporter ATP-binding protein|nr:ABC transporter ATP-binding protein [Sporichthyaceae bacterium]